MKTLNDYETVKQSTQSFKHENNIIHIYVHSQ